MRSKLYNVLFLLTLLLASAGSLKAQTINTYAGTNTDASWSGDGSAATAAGIGTPTGVATDAAGNVYISDGTNHVVRKIAASTGIITTVAGRGSAGFAGDGGAATAARLNYPTGLYYDNSTSKLYIADQSNYCVRVVNASGIITTFAGRGGSAGFAGDGGAATATSVRLNGAADIIKDTSGNFYISDGNYRIRKVDTGGIITTFAGAYSFPNYAGDGGPASAAGFYGLYGLAIDRFQNIYVVDQGNGLIRKINSSGIVTSYAGNVSAASSGYTAGYSGDGGAATAADMGDCYGLACDANGNLYISDEYNAIIRYVNASTGIISTLAGTGSYGYSGDGGAAAAASMYHNEDVTLDSRGNIYIADKDNNVIRNITSAVTINISTLRDTVCAGTRVTFTATLTGAATSPHYHWFRNTTRITGVDTSQYVADSVQNGDTIKCYLLNAAGTDTLGVSNVIRMVVFPVVTPTISIAVSPNDTVCSGTAVTFTATITNGGTSPAYLWTVNGTSASTSGATYSYTPANGDSVVCKLTTNARCATATTVTSSAIRMSVVTTVTPTITIATASDTVCAAPILITATITNGGTRPSYRWTRGGATIGTDTSALYYTPTSGDVIRCILHSNAPCASPDSAVSASRTITVITRLVPSISVHGIGSDTVCSGTVKRFYATRVNGGSAPVLKWRVNGAPRYTGDTFAYVPANGDIVKCMMYPNTCVTVDSILSYDSVKITVINVVTPTVSITRSADSVCAGRTVTFTASGVNAGSSPVYTWRRNRTSMGTGTTYSYAPSNLDTITCRLSSSAMCAVPDSAISSSLIMHILPLDTAGITISASPTGAVCAGTTVTYSSTVRGGGTTPTYVWYKNRIPVGTGSTYSVAPANNDTIVCKVRSNSPCATPDTAFSNIIVMTVNPLVTPTITTAVSPNDTVCSGTTLTFTSSTTYAGSSATYQWRKNGINVGTGTTYSYSTPATGDVIVCRLSSSYPCATPDSAVSTPITMTVIASVTPSISITATPGTSVCAGTTVSFNNTTTNGGSSPAYRWRRNSAYVGTGVGYSYTPTGPDTIRCTLVSNALCRTSDSVFSNLLVMTVNPIVTPSLSIAVSPNDTICAGTSVNFSTAPVNGGTSPTYRWIRNGTSLGGGSTFIYTPANGDTIRCVLHSSNPCASPDSASSGTIRMQVDSNLTPTLHNTVSSDTLCAGDLANFSSYITNGGSSPRYAWRVNGSLVGSTSSYSYAPANGDRITCKLFSSYHCAVPDSVAGDTITMTVNVRLTPSVTVVVTPGTHVSSGTLLTFTATPVNGGTSPTYRWLLNGSPIPGATNNVYSSSTLANLDRITCELTSSEPCVTTMLAVGATDTVFINTGIRTLHSGITQLNVQPNPTNGSFQLSGVLAGSISANSAVLITLTDMVGKVVYSAPFTTTGIELKANIALDKSLADGMYILHIVHNEGTDNIPVQLQR